MLTLNGRVRIVTLHRHIFGVVSPGFLCIVCILSFIILISFAHRIEQKNNFKQ